MDAGLIFAWDILELSCNLSASRVRTTQGVSANSALKTQWCPDWLTTTDGILLTCETLHLVTEADALGTGKVRLRIPDMLVDKELNYTGGWQGSLSGRLEIDNIKLHLVQVAGVFKYRLSWTAMRFYAGATLVWTGVSGSFYSGYITATGVPLIGIPGTLTGSAGVNPAPILGAIPTAGCATSALASYSAQGTGTGGWRFKESGSGAWSTLPVTYQDEPVPAIACGVTATVVEPVATTTYDGSVSFMAEVTDETVAGTVVTNCQMCSTGLGSGWTFTPYHRTIAYRFRGASIMLLPNLDKSVERWGDGADYGALIARYGLPWTKRTASASCFNYVTSADTATGTSTVEVHPEYTSFLAKVENAPHVIEDPFNEVSYAPYFYEGFEYRARGTCVLTGPAGVCPAPAPEAPPADPPTYCGPSYADAISHTVSSQFVTLTQDDHGAGANVDLLSPLYHVDTAPRYLNYVVHPHWSYQYWFPANTRDTDGDGILDVQTVWKLFGADSPNEYWHDLRSQWISHPSLPGGENDRTRNSLVSAPLRDGALSYWMRDTWFGTETSWWGIHRFKARDWTPLANKSADIDSSSLWSALDATLSFGAVYVTVNPSATPCTVYMDLGSLSVEPYLYPHLAKKIILDWVGTNVTSLSCYLDSADGSESVLIATSAGTWDIPITGKDAKYAGSWKQDFGAGYISDEGVDSLPSGISGATMGDTERVVAFSMIGGQQGKRLRFVIEVADIAVDVLLKYPGWIAPTSAPFVFQESGHQSATVWADGAGLRFGSWRWFDYTGVALLTSPVVCEPGTRFAVQGHKSSVLDALRWENLVLNAKPYDDGVGALILTLYDAIEGQTRTNTAYDTLAFIVKGT